MNWVIIGSVSSEAEKMDEVKIKIREIDPPANIVTPVDAGRQDKSLLSIQYEYLKEIDKADFVIALPKNIFLGTDPDGILEVMFGESTTYEMAYTKHIGKPLLIWFL